MSELLTGFLMTSSLTIGLFFWRSWRQTRDRFFALFALAFWALSLNWLGLFFTREDEVRTYFFVLRLVAFTLILLAIWDKNRTGTARRP